MSKATAQELASLIGRLQAERQQHENAIAEIDATFAEFGIATGLVRGPRPRRGRPPGTRRKPTRRGTGARRRMVRRKFTTSGPDSILAFVKQAGAKGKTTGEINRNWESEGRAGGVYVTLGQLVKQKRLKRENLKGQRGSKYTVSA